MTGTLPSSCSLMSPWLTASDMYSKCMVSPLMSTPIAMMASNGAVDFESFETDNWVRSEALPRRSAAAPTTPVEEDWT